MEIKYNINLSWKKEILDDSGDEIIYGDPFSVCLNSFEAWLRDNAGEHYCGNSADYNLRLHFSEQPSQEIIDAVKEKWDSITPESEEALSYKSMEALKEEKAAAKQDAIEALANVSGLSQEQIQALLGQ